MIGRDVRLWVAGTSLSLFGDAALWIALGVWTKDLTGSDGRAGLAFAAYVVPRLGAPFLGLVVDRFRRRPLIALLNLALAGWVCLAFLVHDQRQVWLLLLVLFGVGLGVGLHNAAGSALLTHLVDSGQLGRTNALLRTMQEGGMLVAPAVGSALYVTAGPRAVAALEAVTFLVCALCVLAVRVDEPEPRPSEGRLTEELLAGVRHLTGTPRLRAVALALGGDCWASASSRPSSTRSPTGASIAAPRSSASSPWSKAPARSSAASRECGCSSGWSRAVKAYGPCAA
ncbi:MFS transporter [Streptomyces sp. J2-1]|uniref:MFS transporter n=1 Tax=Streptomyces corallincola TaxID=2851888 RepID=UPI001C3817AB|nr:MFS transporter [Streptomyces corallincola]MBV2357345.1 MFS transporter [Streptomyces corallincola]